MIKIQRRRLFGKNIIEIDNQSKVSLKARRGFAEILMGETSVVKVTDFKNIWIGDERIGARRYPLNPLSKKIFCLEAQGSEFHLSFNSVLGFRGEKTFDIYKDKAIVGRINSMQNIVFMGGKVIARNYIEEHFKPVLAITLYWWMEKNFLTDNSVTGS